MEAAIPGSRTGVEARSQLDARVRVVPALASSERDALLDWLDDGLRAGRRGRLWAEYGPVLGEAATGHVVAESAGRLCSHALYRVCDVQAGSALWRVGMIGLVYTAPEARGCGLAQLCVSQALDAISEAGGQLALLWSDQPGFYARQGFFPAGREVFWRVDAQVRERLGAMLAPGWQVGPPEEADWPRLERLYADSATHVVRSSGLLRGLAAGPECSLRVARREGGVRAYAAFGRGDDFRNVVHEWAGEPEGVQACIHRFAGAADELAVVAGPEPGPLARRLEAAGATYAVDAFALARVLDVGGLWEGLAAGGRVRAEPRDGGVDLISDAACFRLEPEGYLDLLLGPQAPASAVAWLRGQGAGALLAALPAPLYVWGFDSI
jgi:GNAT superfamily N-acetyltransferase